MKKKLLNFIMILCLIFAVIPTAICAAEERNILAVVFIALATEIGIVLVKRKDN